MPIRAVLVLSVLLSPALATAQPADEGPEVGVGFYLQPQLRLRQDSVAPADEDGFRVRRTRALGRGTMTTDGVEVSLHVEAELSPVFTLLDAYATASGRLPADGTWTVDAGQVKAPFSRQEMMSDSRVGFVDKPELVTLAPSRQIGVRANVEVPGVPMVQIWGGVFNGEGVNAISNIDENFMWVGRVEVHPLGRGATLADSAFDEHITVGAHVLQNTRDSEGEDAFGFGVDVSAAWKGISGTFEYTQIDRRYFTGVNPSHHANGLVAQAAYLFLERFEVGARFEEIDRNDVVPVDIPGDPNQSLRYLTGVASYYHRRHDLKAQLQYSHITEVESESRTGADITYANDTLILQLTLRME